MTTTDFKPKRIAPWIAFALFVGGVALLGAAVQRRAYLQAVQGTAEDMQRFKERYPDWNKLAPNRFVSHFFLMENSPIYRAANGVDLANDNLDFDLLGKQLKKKEKR